MSRPSVANPAKEWIEKLFDECEDEFYESYGVYDGKLISCAQFYIVSSHEINPSVLLSQRMTTFLLMRRRRTLRTGRIASEESILLKNTPKLRDWPRHLLGGRKGKAKRRETKRSRATRSCTTGCEENMRSICCEQHAKKKRPGRRRSAGTRRDVQLLLPAAPQLEAQSWATATSPGRLQEAQCRRCWTWCCTVWTGKTCRRFVKCYGSNRRCGTLISSLSDVKPG